jgi:hypothetical protein
MQKTVNSMGTCQEIGVCLNAVRACTGVCRKQAQQVKKTQHFAPGVIDGPYRRQSHQRNRVRVLMLAAVGCWFLSIFILVRVAIMLGAI